MERLHFNNLSVQISLIIKGKNKKKQQQQEMDHKIIKCCIKDFNKKKEI